MKEYSVIIPIAGYQVIDVEANNAKEAIQKAMETEWDEMSIEELDRYEKLIEGNVFYANKYKASAIEN